MPENDEQPGPLQIVTGGSAGSGGSRRRRLLLFGGLTFAAFLVSGVLALRAGGHFGRPPLRGLRGVPLLGALVPPEPEPGQKPTTALPPELAGVPPMTNTQIRDLIADLGKARKRYEQRRAELERDEARLRLLQDDLAGQRKILDDLMAGLNKQRGEVGKKLQQLQAEAIIVRSEERKRIAQNARYFEAQSPESAALEIEKLLERDAECAEPEHLAVKILAQMQEKKAAKIFDALKPELSAELKAKIHKLRIQQDQASATRRRR